MNRLFFFGALFFIITFTYSIKAQTDSTTYFIVEGVVVDDSLNYALPFVHLWNESTRMGGISNKSGEFKIKVKGNDTIVFSALGYHHEMITVSTFTPNKKIHVRLKPKTYAIAEAVVKGYRSYESFKQEFLSLDPTDEKTDRLREYLSNLGTAEAIKADHERAVRDKMNGFGYTTGVGFDKEKAKLEKVAWLKKRDQIINEKYSRELVADITQLSGNELSRFMMYCNFSDEYLYQTDLFTLIEDISNKFTLYKIQPDTIPPIN